LVSNLSKLRASVRAAKVPPEDRAAVEYLEQLAALLDRAQDLTLTKIAAGERPLSLEDRLEVVRIVGPQYGRLLTALGLTRAGRGVAPASSIPTAGAAAGASQDAAAHERHRQRFTERGSGTR
jgi:hypothetical protein